ncbi:uncharacterized protein LOC111262360 isoform X3 [Varroa jacobsoni]|uniref:uncharacterized protein LOC111262360 isoform X3 n=1 Tax=Varroa jacobsoni TaxID=62625 RepID=UPI000BF4EF1D|nr:uncharacterized protein LOC111262360 isoform X3 [Varroa jacobsoni]
MEVNPLSEDEDSSSAGSSSEQGEKDDQPGPPSPHTSSPALVKGLKHMKLPQISPPQNKIAMINPYLNAADPVNQLDPRLSVSKKKPKSARKRRPRRSKSKRRRSCRVRGSVTHRRRQAAEPRRDRT